MKNILLRYISNILLKVNIKPFLNFELVNLFLEYGNLIRNQKNIKLFENKFLLYKYINDLVGNGIITYIEFGVYKGESILYWSQLNKNIKSNFFGLDSFEGLPEDWAVGKKIVQKKGTFNTFGNLPQTDDNRVTFIKGIFQNTLVKFFNDYNELFNDTLIFHFDADLYSSELFCLTQIYNYLKEGSILIFDDFGIVDNDYKAFKNFCQAFLIDVDIIGVTKNRFMTAAIKIKKIRNYY